MSTDHAIITPLIADIGGTNARFARIGADGAPHDERVLPGADYPDIVSFSPANPREAEILNITWQRFGHVSAERLISGMGLQNCITRSAYWKTANPKTLSPADISQRGQSGADPVCAEALETFCAMLGTVAGNLALTLGATGGVYIGGGIVPRLKSYFDASPFRRRCEDKGRFAAYLTAIPTLVIHAVNPAFIGLSKVFGPYRSVLKDLEH